MTPEVTELTPEERAAYMAGYNMAKDLGDEKDWGENGRDDDVSINDSNEEEEDD